jgi:hypothetical protein
VAVVLGLVHGAAGLVNPEEFVATPAVFHRGVMAALAALAMHAGQLQQIFDLFNAQ